MSTMMSGRLAIADYVVIAIMLLVSSGIGVYYRLTGGQQKTTEEYFLADKSMKVGPVAVGLMTSFFSSISILGLPSEIYVYGTQFVVINVSYGLATCCAAYLYLPVFFKLGATSSFEYLHQRFGLATRVIASFGSFLQLVLYTSIALYAPALALETTTGITMTISITVIAVVCTFYSTIGGMKAVLVTDVFQSILMYVAVLVIIVTAAINVGGLDTIWDIASNGSRLEFDNISLDPTVRHTWWSLTFGGFFTYLSLYGCNQVQIQRLSTIKNVKSAQKALWLSWPVITTMSLTTCFSGLAIYTKYRICDPLKTKRISSIDQLMPLYIMDTLSRYPGVPGLLIAGIFSAGLSTISATLNSLAAVILEDYVKPICRARNIDFSQSRSAFMSKVVALVMGFTCLAVAILARYIGGILQAALTILGVVGGPMLGLFTLGMFTETANQRGAIAGFLTSLAFSFWIGFGQPRPTPPKLPVFTNGCNSSEITMDSQLENGDTDDTSYLYLYRISYMWYCPLGFIICFICGWIVSWTCRIIFKETSGQLNPDLLTPVLANKGKFTNRTVRSIDSPSREDSCVDLQPIGIGIQPSYNEEKSWECESCISGHT